MDELNRREAEVLLGVISHVKHASSILSIYYDLNLISDERLHQDVRPAVLDLVRIFCLPIEVLEGSEDYAPFAVFRRMEWYQRFEEYDGFEMLGPAIVEVHESYTKLRNHRRVSPIEQTQMRDMIQSVGEYFEILEIDPCYEEEELSSSAEAWERVVVLTERVSPFIKRYLPILHSGELAWEVERPGDLSGDETQELKLSSGFGLFLKLTQQVYPDLGLRVGHPEVYLEVIQDPGRPGVPWDELEQMLLQFATTSFETSEVYLVGGESIMDPQ